MVARPSARRAGSVSTARLADSLALRVGYGLASIAPGWAQKAVRNPCLVIGCGRSGSTFLRRTLSTHPDLAVYPSEANRYWHPDLYPWTARTVDAPPLWMDPIRFSRASAATWSKERAADIRALFGAFQAARRGRVLVNKSAMVHFMLPAILETFPSAKFIHLVRDGRAVALSSAKRKDPEKQSRDEDFNETLDTESRYWQASMAEIARQVTELGLREDRFLEIRYEDLCADPVGGLCAIAEFLGVQAGPLLELKAGPFRMMNFKFSAELTPPTLSRVSSLMAEALAAKGYAQDA